MPVLEIAVQDAAGARIARSEGAERVELCSALSTGGLTPSVGILRTTIEVGLPVHVLIRPRPGGYVYDATEVEAMVADIVCSMELGAQGVGAADGALIAHASRHGVTPGVRQIAAEEDAEFRRRNGRRLLEVLARSNVYYRAYRPQSLDSRAELDRWRPTGVQTPTAPPAAD